MSNAHEPKSELGPGPSLWTTLRVFFGFPSPRSFLVALPILIAVRLYLGDFSWWDLAVVPLILALEPFAEWLIHVYILHFKPRRVLGRVVDPLGGDDLPGDLLLARVVGHHRDDDDDHRRGRDVHRTIMQTGVLAEPVRQRRRAALLATARAVMLSTRRTVAAGVRM